jgi:hypothetical protein
MPCWTIWMVPHGRLGHDEHGWSFVFILVESRICFSAPTARSVYPEENRDKLNSWPMVNESLILQKGDKLIRSCSSRHGRGRKVRILTRRAWPVSWSKTQGAQLKLATFLSNQRDSNSMIRNFRRHLRSLLALSLSRCHMSIGIDYHTAIIVNNRNEILWKRFQVLINSYSKASSTNWNYDALTF